MPTTDVPTQAQRNAPLDPLPHAGRPIGAPSGVCLLSGEFPPDPGGVGDYTARLAAALADLGIRVEVLTTRRRTTGGRMAVTEPRGAVAVYDRVHTRDFRSWPALLATTRRLGPRPLLHIQYQAGAFAPGGAVTLLPLWLRATLPRARVVTTFHDFRVPYLFPKAGPLRAGANRLLARASHAAIFAEPADLAAAGPGVAGHLIPIGSNVDRAPPASFDRADTRRHLGADERTLLIGYFGFLSSTKGVPTLLRAIAQLTATGRPVRLALIGAPAGASDPTDAAQAERVRATIDDLELGNLVQATGPLPEADVSAALLACDLIALPYQDGASLRRGTLMAALAHGLPIVSTRPPDLPPLPPAPPPLPFRGGGRGERSIPRPERPAPPLRDSDALLLVPPDDPAALADAIARLADDPALRARLAAGASAVAERFAWPEIARQTLAVYRAVLSGSARSEG